MSNNWIPIKTKPVTDEEREYYGEGIEFIYDCPMPEDGQEVLVTLENGRVSTDTYYEDYCFENFYGVGDVVAWMPFPEPYMCQTN